MRLYYFTSLNHGLNNIAFNRIKVSRLNELNDPYEFLSADLSKQHHRESFQKLKEELSERTGMISFSSGWNNPLLWGHYADKHRGLSFGVDVLDEAVTSVLYSETRSAFKYDEINNKIIVSTEFVEKLLRTKYADWDYENEYRMFLDLYGCCSEEGLYFKKFSNDFSLREIILGLNCPMSVDEVRQLIEKYSYSVKVLKAGLALRSFKVIEDTSVRRI